MAAKSSLSKVIFWVGPTPVATLRGKLMLAVADVSLAWFRSVKEPSISVLPWTVSEKVRMRFPVFKSRVKASSVGGLVSGTKTAGKSVCPGAGFPDMSSI